MTKPQHDTKETATMTDKILVPFDGSDDSARSVRVASRLARLGELSLEILTYSTDSTTSPSTPVLKAAAKACAAGDGLNTTVSPIPHNRFLSDELVKQAKARPGSVLCIPSHGLGRRAVVTLSLATDVLVYAECPLVLVGDECDEMAFSSDGPIVVAVDGSAESERIIPVAHEWAQLFGWPIEVVEVLDRDPSPALDAVLARGDVLESGYLANVAKSEAFTGDEVTYDVLHGAPAEEILREAKARNASCIAMSSHVPLGLDRLVHGSVLDSVARKSPIPVLTINQDPFVKPDRGSVE